MKHLDKVAIVTGASMGIGKAVSSILADEGCHIVCAARSTEKLEETAAVIRSKGRKALVQTIDVIDPESIKNMVEATMKTFGRIDILINNAGGPVAGTGVTPPKNSLTFFEAMDDFSFVNIKEKDWNAIFDINFYGALNCTRSVLKVMLKQDSGHILNVTSKAGKIKEDVVPGMIAYSASKAALSRFTEVLAFELMCTGSEVRVNAISPGMIAATFHENLPEEELEAFGQPEDIKDVLLKILDDSNTKSGEIYSADTDKTWFEELKEVE